MEGTLDSLLDGWARWMQCPDLPDDVLDCSPGFECYTIESVESEGHYEALQHRLSAAVNAAIESLSPAERMAFHEKFGLRGRRGSRAALSRETYRTLVDLLRRRGVEIMRG